METKVSGIYKIVNKTNGKYYIGSSNNIHKRWKYHKQDLTRGNHHTPHLQRAWNKYGKDNFDFIIVLSNVAENDLLNEEQKYLDNVNKLECYNTSMIAGKVEFTNEVRQKIKEKLMGNKNGVGRIFSEETRKKISQAQKGKKCPQRGNNKLGKSFTDEHKRKLKEARKRQVFSEETRKKLSENSARHFKGKSFSEEHKKKLRESRRKYFERKNRQENLSLLSVTI